MTRHELRVVAVNDLIDPENLVHLLRFDSAYRRYDQPVAYEPGVEPALRVGRTRMRLVTNANRSVFHRRSTVLTS